MADETAPVGRPRRAVPPRSPRHTRAQWAALVGAVITVAVCFLGAGVLLVGKYITEQRTLIQAPLDPTGVEPADTWPIDSEVPGTADSWTIDTVGAAHPTTLPGRPTTSAPRVASTPTPTTGPAASVVTTASSATAASVPATDPATAATIPEPPSSPRNFLIAAADNHACVDPGSPWASAADPGRPTGDRSDTIMIIRLDPSADRAAVLSFPRDLWVKIPGRGQERINAAYRRNQPDRLIQTIRKNFGVRVDHYIQVDFCAFKRLVEAVGGIDIPFKYPLRDLHSDLDITTSGCHHFVGDEALAYVRSRYLEQKVGRKWVRDGTSDYGRIARQQDFLTRVFGKVLDRGLLDPTVLRRLIETLTNGDIVTSRLSIDQMLAFGQALRRLRPADIARYRITGTGINVESAQVIKPVLNTPAMRRILRIFRGEVSLPRVTDQDQQPDDTVPASTASDGTAIDGTASDGTTPEATSLPTIKDPASNVAARIMPDPDTHC